MSLVESAQCFPSERRYVVGGEVMTSTIHCDGYTSTPKEPTSVAKTLPAVGKSVTKWSADQSLTDPKFPNGMSGRLAGMNIMQVRESQGRAKG